MTKEQTTFINLLTTIEHISMVVDCNQRYDRSHDIAKIVINITAEELGHPIDFCDSCVRDAYIELIEKVTGNQYDREIGQGKMQIKEMFQNKTKTNERNKSTQTNS